MWSGDWQQVSAGRSARDRCVAGTCGIQGETSIKPWHLPRPKSPESNSLTAALRNRIDWPLPFCPVDSLTSPISSLERQPRRRTCCASAGRRFGSASIRLLITEISSFWQTWGNFGPKADAYASSLYSPESYKLKILIFSVVSKCDKTTNETAAEPRVDGESIAAAARTESVRKESRVGSSHWRSVRLQPADAMRTIKRCLQH